MRFPMKQLLMIRENVLFIMDSNYRAKTFETNKKRSSENDDNNNNIIACNFLP